MLALGVVPSTDPATDPARWPDDRGITVRVLRLLEMLCLDPAGPDEQTGELLITPSCGLAGASAAWARRACELSARAASNVAAG